MRLEWRPLPIAGQLDRLYVAAGHRKPPPCWLGPRDSGLVEAAAREGPLEPNACQRASTGLLRTYWLPLDPSTCFWLTERRQRSPQAAVPPPHDPGFVRMHRPVLSAWLGLASSQASQNLGHSEQRAPLGAVSSSPRIGHAPRHSPA